ncbi:DUF2268 domain-containing protein [Enterobacter kobei]|uniref:DUF2268 domain-containing putative Zn-dependent protease n=1 Tax=Enterobacter kobei TaxID=208224 RepID=UPI00207618F8|nr:DUF2268 domain-containing putative Zn-dependent protease [Enterobacter kobei]MCM7047231.1 DUF2268 domain-containing protein [Enterobacter kobei]
MSSMVLHFLNAQEKLTAHYSWLETCLSETYIKANTHMSLPSLDVIVKAGVHVIPEKGHLGYSPEPGVVYITVDPANSEFCSNPNKSLERMFAHELHHAARWSGPGYGFSLGEALVSEGLAGHFAIQVFGGQPEPWECLDSHEINLHRARASGEWGSTDYNHNIWFFGAGDLPRWLGYSLGFDVVSRYLSGHPEQRASTLTDASADVFRDSL